MRYCEKEPLIIDHALDLGIKLLIDNPWEIGSDRIVIALAAHHLYGGPAIIIAFSTATTFDVISAVGRFSGRSHCPRPRDLRRSPEQRRLPPLPRRS